jgi:hypothetical protein
MKVVIEPKESKDIIATVAIGEKYYSSWMKYAFSGWERYCGRHGLGLIVFDTDLLPKTDKNWKKPNWQKLLIGRKIRKSGLGVNNICYLDTDILVNHTAPNIFDHCTQGTIGLVSQRRNLPYPIDLVYRKIAFLRHNLYDKKYPLDSALFMSIEQLYEYHDLTPQDDYFCSGVYTFNLEQHSDVMEHWYYKYDKKVKSVTNGGEQTHLNYEILQNCEVKWLDYRFQADWIFEMAWNFPFLYDYGRYDKELIKQCVEASLFSNYFLHFGGTWHESDMWEIDGVLGDERVKQFEEFEEYLKMPVTGEPKGVIKP